MRKYLIECVAAASLLVVAGCSSIPITSLPKLASMDVMTTDMSTVKIAVRIQEGFRVEGDDVTLTMRIIEGSTQKITEEIFSLEAKDYALSDYLISQLKPGYKIYTLNLKDEDAPRMQSFQAYMRALKQKQEPSSPSNSLVMNVHTDGCLEKGANPFRKMKPTVYLKTEAQSDYFRFIKEQSLDIPKTKDGELEYCEAE